MEGIGGFTEILNLPVFIRKLFIELFVEQKEKEQKAIEAARK
jgi:hypothetical protein